MPQDNNYSRRRFLKTAGATAVVVGGPAVVIPGRAQPKTLKILHPVQVVATFEPWFHEFTRTWGEKNNIRVIVDWVKWDEQDRIEREEIAAQRGHDLFDSFKAPEDQVINHREIYEECEHRYGKPLEAIIKNAYNPKTHKYIRFELFFLPMPVIYRKDLWDAVGMIPDSWDDVRLGGRKISFLQGHPVGISLGPNQISELGLRSLLLAFGASVQDANQHPALKSSQTVTALKFCKTLYDEAMAAEVLHWDNVVANNRYMLAGEGNLTLNPISIIRSAENTKLPLASQLALRHTPEGPAGRLGVWSGTRRFVIWKFADNIELAKQFLVDYVGASRDALLASQYYLLPAFPGAIPDLPQLLAYDINSVPPDKYSILAEAGSWTNHVDYPGYVNETSREVYDQQLLSKMFVAVATGKMTPEEAMNQADQEVRKIYDKWRALGKV